MPDFKKGDFTQQGVAGHVNSILRLNEKRYVYIDLTSNEEAEGCTISGAVADPLNNEVYPIGAGVSGNIEITENGENINVAQYATATVNVTDGGGSYQKIYEGTITANTTSTSNFGLTPTLQIGEEAYTSDKLLYIKIRGQSGKRNGYHYGNDCFIANPNPSVSSTDTVTEWGTQCYHVNDSGRMYSYGPISYGVFFNSLTSTGELQLAARYNATNSGTINDTYDVEVYLLDFVEGANPFEV